MSRSQVEVGVLGVHHSWLGGLFWLVEYGYLDFKCVIGGGATAGGVTLLIT